MGSGMIGICDVTLIDKGSPPNKANVSTGSV